MKRWAALAVAMVVLAAAGVVAWRVWRHEDLCDVAEALSTPSQELPAAAPAARLHPPKPPPDAAIPLLYEAVHFPGSAQLGRLRWALQTGHVPNNHGLHVYAGAGVVLAAISYGVAGGGPDPGGQLAAYRGSDGKLLWRLADPEVDDYGIVGDTVVIQRSKTKEKKSPSGGAEHETHSAQIGLDPTTGKPRWCLTERDTGGAEIIPYSPDSASGGSVPNATYRAGRVVIVNAANGSITKRIAWPGPAPHLTTGAGKLVVRQGNAMWVYRLADARLLYHVADLPHPPPNGSAILPQDNGRMAVAPDRVLVETVGGGGDNTTGADNASLVTAYDDAGHIVWQLPSRVDDPALPLGNRNVFGDAVLIERSQGETFEARRLSDGKLLWRHRRIVGENTEHLTLIVEKSFLYGVGESEITAIDRITGKGTSIPVKGSTALREGIGSLAGGLIATDRSTIVVFDLPD